MSYVSKIIETFGGVRPLARAIGRPVSTVQSWKDRGSIPDDHKSAVLITANELGIPLVPADFFPIDHLKGRFDEQEAATQ